MPHAPPNIHVDAELLVYILILKWKTQSDHGRVLPWAGISWSGNLSTGTALADNLHTPSSRCHCKGMWAQCLYSWNVGSHMLDLNKPIRSTFIPVSGRKSVHSVQRFSLSLLFCPLEVQLSREATTLLFGTSGEKVVHQLHPSTLIVLTTMMRAPFTPHL